MLRKTIWLTFLVFLILSCSLSQFGWKRESESEEKGKGQGVFVEDFDPLSLNDDDIVILPTEETQKDEFVKGQEADKLTQDSESVTEEMIQGYRVQLLATGDEKQAWAAKKKAIFKFEENVYLEFEAPLYKLRVGDCETKKEAEEIREEAIRKEFRDAWIVPSKVYRKKDEASIQ